MAYLSTQVLIFIGCILTPVASQQDIVSVKTIEDESPFTITFSAQQVIIPSSANVTSIASVQIHVLNNGARDYRIIAQYLTLAPPSVDKEFQAPPAGRNWTFNFSGSNSENGGANNRDSMKIEILISDGKFEDAGVYRCSLVYYDPAGISTIIHREQNVSFSVVSLQDIVSVNTVEDSNPFTITCNAQRVIPSSANVSSIASLKIHVLNYGAQDYRLVSQYLIFAPPSVDKEFQAPPAGRNWSFILSGSNSANGGANNRASMKIEILVSDSKIEDAGLYRCTMVYYSSHGVSTVVSREQNVTSILASLKNIVSMKTIVDWSPLTITCSADRVVSPTETISSIEKLGIIIFRDGANDYDEIIYDAHGQNSPPSWIGGVTFSGASSNNQTDMKIEIHVGWPGCGDIGSYYCVMLYNGGHAAYREEIVTSPDCFQY